MIRFLFSFLLIILSFNAFCQSDHVGSGRALQFDGVDDYVDLGNIYDDLTFPFTVSAWMYKAPGNATNGPILVSQDNADWYNGFWFNTSSTSVVLEYGDGKGYNHPAYRRGKSASYNGFEGRWTHVCAVALGKSNIELYVNGINVGGSYGGQSSGTMASDFPGDVAKIGYFFTNGIVYRFTGVLDELRVYNRALPEAEIRSTMCRRLKGDEPGLIGYWDFDETDGTMLLDHSPNGFHGVIKGNATRVFSGTPVGDESVVLYTNTWTGKSVQKNQLSVTNVQGTAGGMHIYTVNNTPSQTTGLDATFATLPYYGIFIANALDPVSYDLIFEENNVCSYFQRKDNSVPQWLASKNLLGLTERREIIPSFEPSDFKIDLGEDVVICDQSAYSLSANTDPAEKTFLWSTGETTPTITATTSGNFSVEVRAECRLGRDTIQLSFMSSPPAFSLGEDETLCALGERTLMPTVEGTLDFTWSDGSKEKSFTVSDFGTYWLKVSNACGISVDSITFTRKVLSDIETYNFISPGNNDDRNQFFVVDERLQDAHLIVFNRWGKPVFESSSYNNNWDAAGLPAGIYFYMLNSACGGPFKGTLTVMR